MLDGVNTRGRMSCTVLYQTKRSPKVQDPGSLNLTYLVGSESFSSILYAHVKILYTFRFGG